MKKISVLRWAAFTVVFGVALAAPKWLEFHQSGGPFVTYLQPGDFPNVAVIMPRATYEDTFLATTTSIMYGGANALASCRIWTLAGITESDYVIDSDAYLVSMHSEDTSFPIIASGLMKPRDSKEWAEAASLLCLTGPKRNHILSMLYIPRGMKATVTLLHDFYDGTSLSMAYDENKNLLLTSLTLMPKDSQNGLGR